MTEQFENYLALARRARAEDNVEDARKYYDLVREGDPDDLEARFFYSYYRLWDGTNGETYSRFIDTCNASTGVAKAINNSSYSKKDKNELINSMYDYLKDLPLSVSKIQVELFQTANNPQYNQQNKKVQKTGIELMYKLGDLLEEQLGGDNEAINICVKFWKQGVTLQQKWPYCGINKELVNTYMTKIQKHDSSFVLPKKTGCISFA